MTDHDRNVVASVPTGAKEETGFQAAYADFARNLRTWLLAYGVGAPILMVSQDTVARAIVTSPDTRVIVNCFLAGVAIQVLMALVYKGAMWYLYLGEIHHSVRERRRYRASDWLSEQFWLEIGADLLTVGLFAYATLKVVYRVTGEMPSP